MKFNGNLYLKLNFEKIDESNLNYFYFKGNNLISRYQAQKHKLFNLLEKFDSNLSETENMFNNGYNRYWDCGNNVFLYKRKGIMDEN